MVEAIAAVAEDPSEVVVEATPKAENASSAKTFSTCLSTWTRTSASSSTAAEKVFISFKTDLKYCTDVEQSLVP